MAQSGYGYDPLHGYHPQTQYAHQPYPSYPASTHSYPNGAVQNIAHGQPAPRDSYNQHNVIPGLGLNFSQNAAQWPASWAGQPHSFGQAPPATEGNGPSRQADMSEEGEVSEGEVEDAYEPRDAEVVADVSYQHGNGGYSAEYGIAHVRRVAVDPSAAFSAGRDRSGSYSPYLSPQEIDHQAMADSPDESHSTSTAPAKASQLSPKVNEPNHTAANSSPVKNVAAARKQAQDAILRLWPLNVRYQNYIDEGIDESLLGGLFEELGFATASPGNITATDPSHEKRATTGTKNETLPTGSNQRESDTGGKPASAPVKDKSEERKDRIARLLAAKSSKPSTSSTSAPIPARAPVIVPATTPSSHTPVPRQQGSAKSQSEKSKLLYSKMEALRKARELEARGQKRPHQDVLPQTHQAKDNADGSMATATASFDTSTNRIRSASQEHTPGQSESPNGQFSLSIPGLFLSSTPQPAHFAQVSNLERPASTSVMDSNPRPFKRPFGQTRRSRPFLIDVSDDEDDAEMDIDSPEQKVVSLTTRPNLKTSMSLRNIPSAAGNQQYSSPLTTPPSSGSDNHARQNLDSMTKKIEAMKRRIAEAEARKKAKQSQPDSPALPTLNDDSLNSSFEAAIANKDTTIPVSLSIEPRELSHSTPSVSGPSPKVPHQLLDSSPLSVNERRRSRSRAASERLPAIEARRREQQLKLQLLQAQMANIQREIERSLEEEEKLKEDVDNESDSEQTQERQDEAQTPSKPPSPSSPLTDAMDIASTSPQSNDASQYGREAPVHQTEKSREEQQPGMLMIAQAGQNLPTASQAVTATAVVAEDAKQEAVESAISTHDSNITAAVDEAQDMAMSESGDFDNADSEDGSDDYEPPDVELSGSSGNLSRASTPFSPAPADLVSISETSPNDFQSQDNTTDAIATQQISTVQRNTASESGREVDVALHAKGRSLYLIANQVDQTTFVPYESPLRYFRAYRFHPEYSRSVAGGLRSLTYSNKIDVKQEMCPDELANSNCPRGKECHYQHFESMQAPDDQILLQLGAHGDFEEQKKHEYINGLRHLLTDFRNRKVKDFQTISQGIIDYRAQFLGDRSKILPLGGVTI
ncbi:uncharacterized protein Triagg1_5357 [Trichoderma aggressivum f. europaeum]|uniref:C3H1-type domain-containing protein n=1 Tax=Trichoderma aggressivum f. europaeum TaxID=173218 RepID=A0AAE1IDH8_9HYPO|nr:hypothetical protein Triagg1_5357 [Trichoderma aggressivum f. europaeum]